MLAALLHQSYASSGFLSRFFSIKYVSSPQNHFHIWLTSYFDLSFAFKANWLKNRLIYIVLTNFSLGSEALGLFFERNTWHSRNSRNTLNISAGILHWNMDLDWFIRYSWLLITRILNKLHSIQATVRILFCQTFLTGPFRALPIKTQIR